MTDLFVATKNESKQKAKSSSNSQAKRDHMPVLSSFCQTPKGIFFQNQRDKETIILFLRSHFITNFTWIVVTIFLVFLPLLFIAFIPAFGPNFLSSPSVGKFLIVYLMFYYLILFSYVFISFLHWFYNVFMVTTQRVVDIDYSDIVYHNIAITNLSHVQDVDYTQAGFIPSFFNYGDVFVQTAGEETNFEALAVPKPGDATHIIGNLIGKAK